MNADRPDFPYTCHLDHVGLQAWHHIPNMPESKHCECKTPAEGKRYTTDESADAIAPEFGADVAFVGVDPYCWVAVDTLGLGEHFLP